jgi:DNA-binding transcriptional ArsR family regulator
LTNAAMLIVVHRGGGLAMGKKKDRPPTPLRDQDSADVLARQGLRYRILRLIYEAAEGAVDSEISTGRIREREGITHQTLEQVLGYLRDEKLVNAPQYGAIYTVSLRHKGLVELERAILDPAAGTEHFDSKVTSAFARDARGVARTMLISQVSKDDGDAPIG